jgi:hypothetical protein
MKKRLIKIIHLITALLKVIAELIIQEYLKTMNN